MGLVLAVLFYAAAGYLSHRVAWLPAMETAEEGPPLPAPDYRVLRGVTSVHTERSRDATGTLDHVARAGVRRGLDFVLVGDHPSGNAPLFASMYRDSVLLVLGEERALEGVGRLHLFGLPAGVSEEALLGNLPRLLEESGGTAAVVHGRPPTSRDHWRWHLDHAGPAHAWEVLDLSEGTTATWASVWGPYHIGGLLLSLPLGLESQALVRTQRSGFRTAAVAAYDSLSQDGHLVALAALNHHPKTVVAGVPLPTYGVVFNTFVNHVGVGEPPADTADEEAAALGRAIRTGNVFFSVGHSHEASPFRLAVVDASGHTVPMGGSVPAHSGLRLRTGGLEATRSPLFYRIVRDSQELALVAGPTLDHAVNGPGVYRVEVYRYRWRLGRLHLDVRPWIFTNPIWVVG